MTDLTLWEQEYKKLEPYNIPKQVNDMTDTWRRDVIARKRVELWRMQQQYGAAAAPCQRLGLRINQIVQQDLALPEAWEDNHDAATEQLIAGLPAENPYEEGSVEYRLVELARGKVATRSEGLKTGGRRRMSSARVVDHIIEDIEYHKLHGTFDGWSAEMLERMEKTYGDVQSAVVDEPPAVPEQDANYYVPQSLIHQVKGYYRTNKDRADRNFGENWLRVLIAFGDTSGVDVAPGLTPYTAAEARESEKIWSGWAPVREALEKLETSQTAGSDAAPPEVDDEKLPMPKVFRGLKGQNIREHLLDEKDGDRRALIAKETALLHNLPHWTDADAGEYYRRNGYGLPYTPQCANPYTKSVYGQPNGIPGLSKTGNRLDSEIIALLKLTEQEVRNREKAEGADVQYVEHPEYGWRFLAYKWGDTAGGGVNAGILPETIEARDNQPLVAPAHKRRFLEWLANERDVAAKINGAGHPVVKNRVLEKLIEYVEQDVAENRGDLQVQYDNFLGWLRGEYGQRTIHDKMVWADGSEDDLSLSPEFGYNGIYVTDNRTGCTIPYDGVARRRKELTAENVRYRLSRNPKLGAQISWLALDYSGFLCSLPNNTETETRMVPAEEVRQLIIDGYDVLTPAQYADNQRTLHSRDDKFAAFNLFVQTAPDGRYLGVCPEQGDPSGPWTVDRELFDAIKGKSSQERTVVVPDDIADAIERGDWATVARLAGERA